MGGWGRDIPYPYGPQVPYCSGVTGMALAHNACVGRLLADPLLSHAWAWTRPSPFLREEWENEKTLAGLSLQSALLSPRDR